MDKSKSIGDGVYLSMKFYVPLSIISYFNEVKNGCFDPFTRSCQFPPGYILPKISAFLLAIILLLYAWENRRGKKSDERDFSKGLVIGTIVGFFLFFVFTMGGFWGWEFFTDW